MSRHRAAGRPRYGRIAVLGASVSVTAVAVLGSVGVLPTVDETAAVAATDGAAAARDDAVAPAVVVAATGTAADEVADVAVRGAQLLAPPAASGQGRRVVFSESRQRVWLVGQDGPQRTYLVSGSLTDNLDPGTYAVYSRSEDAYGIDDSGTMKWFVRFTQGENAAIGFHDIPVDEGRKVQGTDELGTPTSHGCIRQRTADAKALWDFAPIGTTVVVTA